MVNWVNLIDNLVIGYSGEIPDDIQLTICCSRSIFNKISITSKHKSSKNPNLIWTSNYRSYVDLFNNEEEEIDADVVVRVIKILHDNLSKKKIYLYCEKNEQDALMMGFIYLVMTEKLDAKNLETALLSFNVIFPGFSPSPEWCDFLYYYFPYNSFLIN